MVETKETISQYVFAVFLSRSYWFVVLRRMMGSWFLRDDISS
jgi:hypothetical protein